MAVTFNVKGLEQLRREIDDAIDDGLMQAARQIHDRASELAPVGVGRGGIHLYESGRIRRDGKDKVLITFGVGTPDKRAPAQEFGTIFMDAQPYLSEALKQISVADIVAERFRKVR